MRTKEDYDGAEPSGNDSVAALALLKLAAITDDKTFKDCALKKHFSIFPTALQEFPQAIPHMLLALDFLSHEPRRAVVVGQDDKILHAIHSVYQPNKGRAVERWAGRGVRENLPTKDAPIVFLCTGTACQPPTKDVATIKKLLGDADHFSRKAEQADDEEHDKIRLETERAQRHAGDDPAHGVAVIQITEAGASPLPHGVPQ